MARKVKVSFVTNMCTHYVARLFELLSGQYDVDFYFTGGDEHYWNKENKPATANIRWKYLKRIVNAFTSNLRNIYDACLSFLSKCFNRLFLYVFLSL